MERRRLHPNSLQQRTSGRRGDFAATLLAILLVSSSISTVCALQQPFQPAETALALARRQTGGCLANFYSCANQGAVFSNICCQTGQVCALDASNQPACCPANAVCTGTAPATFVTPTAAPTVSFVPNAYFSFPYVQTSFANAAACTSAVSQCSANYDTCSSRLAGLSGNNGGTYGVTIVVGGGTTVVGGNAGITLPAPSPSSVCSSLSSVACSGLQSSMCTMSGTQAGAFYFGTGNAAAKPTPLPCVMAGVLAAGVGLGIVNGL